MYAPPGAAGYGVAPAANVSATSKEKDFETLVKVLELMPAARCVLSLAFYILQCRVGHSR
jgi:hypothetical protein